MAGIAAFLIVGYVWQRRAANSQRHNGSARSSQGDPRFSVKKHPQTIAAQEHKRDARLVATSRDPVYGGRMFQHGGKIGARVRPPLSVIEDHGKKQGLALHGLSRIRNPSFQPHGNSAWVKIASEYHEPQTEQDLVNRAWNFNNIPNTEKALHLTGHTGVIPQKI